MSKMYTVPWLSTYGASHEDNYHRSCQFDIEVFICRVRSRQCCGFTVEMLSDGKDHTVQSGGHDD